MICANFKSWHQFTVSYLKFFVPVKYYNFQVVHDLFSITVFQ